MKHLHALLVTTALALVASLAIAGSYLDRAALLIGDARRGNEWVLSHLGDRELAQVARDVAEARVKTSRAMSVPKEVVAVHPHLLLMLENSERACAAAADGDNDRFMHHLRVARDEDAAFKSLVTQLKLPLPVIK